MLFKPKARLRVSLGPEEILVGTPTPTLIADFTNVNRGEGVCVIQNKAGFDVYFCLWHGIGSGTPSGTPPLTTGNGLPIPTLGYLTLDNIGGMAVWAIAGTPQVAGSGTRIIGAKTGTP